MAGEQTPTTLESQTVVEESRFVDPFSFDDLEEPAPSTQTQPQPSATPVTPEPASQQPPAQQQPANWQEAIARQAAQWDRDIAEGRMSVGQALVQSGLMGAQFGATAAKQEVARNAVSTNHLAVDNWKRNKSSADPKVWKAIAGQLEAKIGEITPDEWALVPTNEIISSLETEYRALKGDLLDKILSRNTNAQLASQTPANQPAPVAQPTPQTPPNYGGGVTRPTTQQTQPLAARNYQDEMTIEIGRMAGLTDAEIGEVISDWGS